MPEEGDRSELTLGEQWEAVGPFPSGMREHPLTSSPLAAFPRNPDIDPDIDFALRPFSRDETFPSALGKGGRVGWSTFRTDRDGWTSISYPDIRWEQQRSDHGWASLQFQSLLRRTMVVPPSKKGSDLTEIRVELVQGLEYAFVPLELDGDPAHARARDREDDDKLTMPKWYAGDVYSFANTPSGSRKTSSDGSNFTRSIMLAPGKYMILVKAIYEIRMFGDPGPKGVPTINLCFVAAVEKEESKQPWEVVEGLRVVPDIFGGQLMGDWISVPIRLGAGAGEGLKVMHVSIEGKMGEFVQVKFVGGPIDIYPGQIRSIPIRLHQRSDVQPHIGSLQITFHLEYRGRHHLLHWKNDLKRIPSDPSTPFTITFASPLDSSSEDHEPSLISYATVVPPKISLSPNDSEPPVLLGLHGAGVDVENPFWAKAIPAVPRMWAVLPTGKNEWGEDWHGGSMGDVWAARDALSGLLARVGQKTSDQTLLVGHSNGGQGAWHLAARYPDRIVGVIAASGWLKIQDYVPYTSLTSTHYADPALMGILQSSLTQYNNDLYASNLARIPVLAIHGSEDTNVPPRHSRQYIALIQSWEHDNTSKKLVEVPKKGHWWDDVLKQPEVFDFIKSTALGSGRDWEEDRKKGFTLTSANPEECGGRSGVRILELKVPGRMARLDVNAPQWDKEPRGEKGMFHGMNVRRFSFQPNPTNTATVMACTKGLWAEDTSPRQTVRMYGPMIRLLATNGPMRLVVNPSNQRSVSTATRYAHDLYVYHRIAVDIISDKEAVSRASTEGGEGARNAVGIGNIISIGRPDQNTYTAYLLEQSSRSIPLSFPSSGEMSLAGRTVYERGAGVIALHPHPTSPTRLAAIVAGNDDEGLELAARLLPLRTGVPVPDWAIIGPRSRWQAAGGLIGAGFWDSEWQYSDCMSWMDR